MGKCTWCFRGIHVYSDIWTHDKRLWCRESYLIGVPQTEEGRGVSGKVRGRREYSAALFDEEGIVSPDREDYVLEYEGSLIQYCMLDVKTMAVMILNTFSMTIV